MGRRIAQHMTLLSAAATSVGTGWRVSDFRNCILRISGSSDADLTVFIKGGLGKGAEFNDSPDFSVEKVLRDEDSAWDYIEVVDLEDGTAIDGDTGVTLSGNVMRLVEVNINSLDWITVESTAIVAGTVTVVGVAQTNA